MVRVPNYKKNVVQTHPVIQVLRINGDTIKDSKNPNIYKKVPWGVLYDTILHTPEANPEEETHPHRCTQFYEQQHEICGTFVINKDNKCDILWSDTIISDYRNLGYDKDPPAVTKEDIVKFCCELFTPFIYIPNVKNYKRDWFVGMMIMRAAHLGETSPDSIKRAQDVLCHRRPKPDVLPPSPIIHPDPPVTVP
jgi:hypothetical protein